MRYLVILLGIMIYSGTAFGASFEIEILNLTKGQPMTPPVIVVHKKTFNLYHLTKEASTGLKALSQDGITSTLKSELENNIDVSSIIVGESIITPGNTEKYTIQAKSREEISIVSMLAATNDAFVGIKNVKLNIKKGKEKESLMHVYDSGAENNTESNMHIPGLGSANVGTDTNEGYVHPHPGIKGDADLDLNMYAFTSFAGAEVIIRRM